MLEKFMMAVFVAIILLSATDVFSATSQLQPYNPEGFSFECPYGDAVIVGREDGKVYEEVECVTYNASKNLWTTWFQNLKGEKLYQEWEPSEYTVFNMDGELVPTKKGMMFKPSYSYEGPNPALTYEGDHK